MGSFLPASALDTFLFFLCFSFPFPPSFCCDIFCLCFFCLPTFPFLLQNCSLPPTWQDKMGTWRKWPFPHFATTLASYILFFSLHNLYLLCAYECLIFTSCLEEDRSMRLYNEENKRFGREAERGKRETSLGSTACGKSPDLPVPTGTFWTLDTALLFPLSSKRKTDVLPFCSPT